MAIARDRSFLQLNRGELGEDGAIRVTEMAGLQFDRHGNVKQFMGGTVADLPQQTRKFLGLFTRVSQEEYMKRRIAACYTTTKLVEFVFNNLDE